MTNKNIIKISNHITTELIKLGISKKKINLDYEILNSNDIDSFEKLSLFINLEKKYKIKLMESKYNRLTFKLLLDLIIKNNASK